MNGAEILLRSLLKQGVETIFGYPGGKILRVYDALYRIKGIRHILFKHEQGAIHAAQGYARVTGKPGVVLVTSGPGATNTVSGMGDAFLDSTPIICISGQVETFLIGSDAFQEGDTSGIMRSITKHSYFLDNVDNIQQSVAEAFFLATSGRQGPILIDFPADIQGAQGEYQENYCYEKRASYDVPASVDENAMNQAVDYLLTAKKPIIYCGGGVIAAGERASDVLKKFVHCSGIPITLTLMGLGAYPAEDPHFLGMLGMHGTYEANMAMHECDVMLCIGARFDDRVTGNIQKFSPFSKKIHMDIDPSSVNKNIAVDVVLLGDALLCLEKLYEIYGKKQSEKVELKSWWAQIQQWKEKDSFEYGRSNMSDDIILPQYFIERLYELTKDRDVYMTTDVGQHQMWAAQYYKFQKPRHFVTSGGFGTMGFGVPAALGCQIGKSQSLVICISGDASFMMNMQEVITAVQHGIPVKIVILNNGGLGMVRQWQDMFFDERRSQSTMNKLPDFAVLAQAMGAKGIAISCLQQVDQAIFDMIHEEGPVILDVKIPENERVFPMIPSGKGHNEMLLRSQGAV